MKYLINAAFCLMMVLSLSGCLIVDGEFRDWDDNNGRHDNWKAEQRENRALISELEIGETRAKVRARLGAPSFSEAFTQGDNEYRVLYYRTQHRHSDGDTTIDETTPLIFKNNQLVGWGHDVLDKLID